MSETQSLLSRFLIISVLLFSGCGQLPSEQAKPASQEVDFGTVKDSVYQNVYFGLEVKIPSDWTVQDQAARQQLAEAGKKLATGDDKNLSATLKAAEHKTMNLLMALQHPIGSPVNSNPSFLCMAERVREQPGIQRGKDYLFHARKMMEMSQMKVQFPSEIVTQTVGGIEFDVMPVTMNVGLITIHQKYCVAIIKGYALSFIIGYANDDEEAMLQDILKTVVLK